MGTSVVQGCWERCPVEVSVCVGGGGRDGAGPQATPGTAVKCSRP